MFERSTPKATRPGRARRGFTMIELMIAMSILLIAVLSAFGSQLTSAGLMRTSRETNTALADLQGCMERILLEAADDLPLPGGGYEPGQPVAAYTDAHLSNETIVPTYPGYVPGGPVPDPLPIVLTCSWNDYQGRERTLTLSSLKAK